MEQELFWGQPSASRTGGASVVPFTATSVGEDMRKRMRGTVAGAAVQALAPASHIHSCAPVTSTVPIAVLSMRGLASKLAVGGKAWGSSRHVPLAVENVHVSFSHVGACPGLDGGTIPPNNSSASPVQAVAARARPGGAVLPPQCSGV